jgi:hypothetical protein
MKYNDLILKCQRYRGIPLERKVRVKTNYVSTCSNVRNAICTPSNGPIFLIHAYSSNEYITCNTDLRFNRFERSCVRKQNYEYICKCFNVTNYRWR